MAGRKTVCFTLSGEEIYWLSGARPERIYERDLPEEPQPEPAPVRRGRKPNVAKPIPAHPKPDGRKKSREKKVLVFDAEQKLALVCADLEAASGITHILKDAIDKLCKSKKPSQDIGLYFRKLWKNLGPDINIMDFSLTLARYDELCKRTPKHKAKNQ